MVLAADWRCFWPGLGSLVWCEYQGSLYWVPLCRHLDESRLLGRTTSVVDWWAWMPVVAEKPQTMAEKPERLAGKPVMLAEKPEG